jgi:hypothetical protein
MTVSWSITRRAEFEEPMAGTGADVDFQTSIATWEGFAALSIYFDPIKEGSILAGRNLAGISRDTDCRDCKCRGGHVPCSKSTTSHSDMNLGPFWLLQILPYINEGSDWKTKLADTDKKSLFRYIIDIHLIDRGLSRSPVFCVSLQHVELHYITASILTKHSSHILPSQAPPRSAISTVSCVSQLNKHIVDRIQLFCVCLF